MREKLCKYWALHWLPYIPVRYFLLWWSETVITQKPKITLQKWPIIYLKCHNWPHFINFRKIKWLAIEWLDVEITSMYCLILAMVLDRELRYKGELLHGWSVMLYRFPLMMLNLLKSSHFVKLHTHNYNHKHLMQ